MSQGSLRSRIYYQGTRARLIFECFVIEWRNSGGFRGDPHVMAVPTIFDRVIATYSGK